MQWHLPTHGVYVDTQKVWVFLGIASIHVASARYEFARVCRRRANERSAFDDAILILHARFLMSTAIYRRRSNLWIRNVTAFREPRVQLPTWQHCRNVKHELCYRLANWFRDEKGESKLACEIPTLIVIGGRRFGVFLARLLIEQRWRDREATMKTNQTKLWTPSFFPLTFGVHITASNHHKMLRCCRRSYAHATTRHHQCQRHLAFKNENSAARRTRSAHSAHPYTSSSSKQSLLCRAERVPTCHSAVAVPRRI